MRILPRNIANAIGNLTENGLQELRLKAEKPVVAAYFGKKYYLSQNGITTERQKALTTSAEEVGDLLLNACQHSLHSFEEQLAKGFISPFDGIRIGVCGSAVTQNGKVISFKNVSSLNVRFHHEVKNCSKSACDFLLRPLKNVLVISEPGGGKTTFLRDLIFQTSLSDEPPNVLLADERNEVAACADGKPQYDLGDFCDVISMADKAFAMQCGIRTMAPQILAGDEIIFEELPSLKKIASAGVKLFCTMHGKADEFFSKISFDEFASVFERFVFLSAKNTPGELVGVFDERQNKLL